ncbi:Gldg family protein [Desulfococcus sp.]|uniref:GldG family protein n=1 Tax=Desulfococcus sp. TaxID=2025834 RepID=UPI003D10FF0B
MTTHHPPAGQAGKSFLSIGGLLLVLIILVLVNVIASRVNARWDVTEGKLYSLSDGTREILSNLSYDTAIKVFYTRDETHTPVHIKTYARRLMDFLSEYERHGEGKLTIEHYDPEPDSEAEDQAAAYGISGIDLPTGERLYFGLAAVAADQEAVIPMIDPTREEQLEYDITRIIARVQSAEKPTIGIISALPVFGMPMMGMPQEGGPEPWMFVSELRKNHEVREISPGADSIDESVDLLMLIHPKGLSPALQYAVDQYLLRGGNLMVFADPFSVSEPPRSPSKASDGLAALFKAWGVEMDLGKAVVDFDFATRLRGQDNQVETNPFWLSMDADALNRDNIITAQLESLLLPAAGAVLKAPDSPYTFETLVRSSPNAAMSDTMMLQLGAEDLRRDFKAAGTPFDLAVQITGTFKSAFPEGPPRDPESGTDKPGSDEPRNTGNGHLEEGQGPAVVVLVGDADLLFDNYYVSHQNFLGFKISRMFNDNLNFVLNSGEMLIGSQALIGIRSRGTFERPFTRVEALEKAAQARWLVREQELMRRIDDTNRKLEQLEEQKEAAQQLILSEAQEAEIRAFQEERRRINKELKTVRRNLRADIERLGNTVKFINTFLMVFVVAAAGMIYGLRQRLKSRR